MKLLLDTNILLDCMMDRQPFAGRCPQAAHLGRARRGRSVDEPVAVHRCVLLADGGRQARALRSR